MGLSGKLLALKKGSKPMPPPGQSGASGYSGYSGKSGYSGYSGSSGYSGISGFSGAAGTGPLDPSGNIEIPGSLSTGVGGGATGDIAFLGSTSGAVHLTVQNDAGTGIFYLPNTVGTHTLATLDDLQALYEKLTNP